MAHTGVQTPLYEADTRLVLLDPSRTARVILTDWLSYKAAIRIYEQSTLEIVLPYTSAAWTTQYSSASAASTYWANWSIDFYFRGVKKFSGPVAAGSIRETAQLGLGGRPVAYATLRCCSWLVWFLAGRTIQNTTGGGFVATTTPWDDIMREMVRVNCEPGSVEEPPNWDTAVDRDDFGPFTLQVEADTSTASDGDFRIQNGKPLLDTTMGLCTMPEDLEADGLWPYVVETSTPGTFEFRVLVGRGGGSRGIGSDKTASVYLAPSLGTVKNLEVAFDHLQVVTAAGVSGTRRGADRRRTWIADASLAATFGTREDELDLPDSVEAYEREAEAHRILNESNAETTRTWTLRPVEQVGQQYAVDVNEKDTVLLAIGSTGETAEKMIIGADVEATAPDPASVAYIFGTYPRDPIRDAQRSGGGGVGGGRRAGGKPKDGDGQSEQDPDAIQSYKQIATQSGTVDAEEANNYLDYKGRWNDQVTRIKTSATDSGDSDSASTPDKVRDAVETTYTADATSPTGYVWIWEPTLGRYIQLLARDPGAGLPAQPTPTENT